MSSLIQQVAARAFNVVRNSYGRSSSEFQELVNLVSKINVKELNYDAKGVLLFSEAAVHHFKTYSPCVYTEIYEDQSMNLSIFGIRDGGEIPLHDHPTMTGILKVICGTLRIASYTKTSKVAVPNGAPKLFQQKLHPKSVIFPTIVHQETLITADDPPIVLGPKDNNLHRVSSVDGYAAFFDLLTPPYYPPHRDCHYYTILDPKPGKEKEVPNSYDQHEIAWMVETNAPMNFSCDTAFYQGERVNLDDMYQREHRKEDA